MFRPRYFATLPSWKTTVKFIPPVKTGIVIKVYDGDTITVASKLPMRNSPIYRFSVRLAGIDAPEMRGKSNQEKNAAIMAQKALESIVLYKTVRLENHATEKYGRILADVYLDDLWLNKWLLDNDYAVPYSGGTKPTYKIK